MPTSVRIDGRVKRMLISVTVIAGLLLLDGQLGPLSFPFRRIAASALLAVLLLGVAPFKGRLPSSLAIWAAAAFTAVAPTVSLALLTYIFAVTVMGMNVAPDDSLLAPGLPQTCLAYVGIGFLSDLLPQSRVLGEALSASAHGYLQVTTGTTHHLSPTALGGPAIVFLTIYLLWRWRLSGSWLRLLGGLVVPVVWFLVLPLVVLPASTGPIAIFIRGTCYGVFWVACAALIDVAAPPTADITRSAGRKTPRSLLISGCMASLLIGTVLSGFVNPAIPANRSILVHNRGGLDWDRPIFGKFGAFSGGMFGLLPVYARANGYRFEILDQDEIQPDDLLGFQILVLINSPKEWKGAELQTVRDFVASGGSLLVMGDHTDVFGLMKGFNSLLEGFGIHFQFDSAYHARATWRGCLATATDTVACKWEMENPGVAIGASLRLRGWSRSLLCGRYAHSDLGDRSNVIGSFLGNYSYDQGEELGDVVLVASATHGRGRLIVFGDTSPFQGGLSYSYPRTVGPVLNFLSRPTSILERPQLRGIAAALMVAMILVSWANRMNSPSTAAIIVMLLAGVAGGWATNRLQLHSPISIDTDCFLIDQSHLPAVGHYEAKFNPSGPLNTNLLRCGLRVADLDKWDYAVLAKAKGIAFIAPQRSFTRAEIEDLLRFEKGGGIVLIAVGHPDYSATRPLLLAHGLDLEARPLGTVPRVVGPGRRVRETPRFLDAWPIVSTSDKDLATVPGIDVLYRAENDVTALFRRQGRGGLLLFSDSRYFSTMNVEDTWGHSVGNLALIHDVFGKYLAVDADAVRPLFRSPKKPE